MTPVETLTFRLLDGEITTVESEQLRRLLAEDERARDVHFAICQQEGLLRTAVGGIEVVDSTMAQVRSLTVSPPVAPPPVATTGPVTPAVRVESGRHGRSRAGRTRRGRRSRRLFWFVSAACLLLAAGVLALYSNWPLSSREQPLAHALPREPARIANVGPDVRIERAGNQLEAIAGLELQPADKITVAEQSWATLAYRDATSVLLHPGTEVVFQPAFDLARNSASKRLLLLEGMLAAQVAKQAVGRSAEFATGDAVARVLGTRLLLTAGHNETDLDVLHGQVQLTRSSDLASVDVSTGFSAVTRTDTKLVARPTAARVDRGLISLYLFDEGEGTTVHDRSGNGEPLDLQIGEVDAVRWLPNGALELRNATVIKSTAPPLKIVEACRQSNEVTIEAWIQPSSLTQSGPARIVSLSMDPYHRNFTLAQETAASDSRDNQAFFLTRLRCTGADTNGFPELRTPPGIVETELTHVIYTRNATGRGWIYIDGVPRASLDVPGDVSDWDKGYRFHLGNEATMDRPWLGQYHLVAIYSRALTGQEVLQNWRAFLTGR